MGRLVAVAVVTFLVDRIVKIYVLNGLNLAEALYYPVLPPYLDLRMAWNEGINFGLFAGESGLVRWVLIALALGISVWIWFWARRERRNRALQLFAGLLIGGAVGNVIDRLWYGAVADYLNMSVPGIDNPYSFNIADVAIFFGAIGLVLVSGRDKTP